jgi:hypothetical protein
VSKTATADPTGGCHGKNVDVLGPCLRPLRVLGLVVIGVMIVRPKVQEKARQLRRAFRGEHEVLRNAKPEYCLPKPQRRQGRTLVIVTLVVIALAAKYVW